MSSKVLFVGLGKMGTSLMKGLLDSDYSQSALYGFDLHKRKRDEIDANANVNILSELSKDAGPFDFIVLCVKPQDLAMAAKQSSSLLRKNGVVVSILAGVTTETIQKHFKSASYVVRAMPNIAALVGEAATVLASPHSMPDNIRSAVESLFDKVGTCSWTKESLMDAVTGLSGSGPAYVYMIIEALADGGVKMGLPRRLALELSVQTILGAGKLVKESSLHPAVLREEVTTPGGTTIHAIQDLEERGLRAMLMSAVEKATVRSQDLNQK